MIFAMFHTHLVKIGGVHLRRLNDPLIDIGIDAKIWTQVVRDNEEDIWLCQAAAHVQKEDGEKGMKKH